MKQDLLSTRARNALREALKNRTLGELEDLFSECDIPRGFPRPQDTSKGERHRLIEEYFSLLNLALETDVHKVLRVIQRVVEDSVDTTRLEKLVYALKGDGFAIERGRLVAKGLRTQVLFATLAPQKTISSTTRNAICDWLSVRKTRLAGQLIFSQFIRRLFEPPVCFPDVALLGEMLGAGTGLSPLRVSHCGIGLIPLEWPDEPFTRILAESLHPEIRQEGEASELLRMYNDQLGTDGWEVARGEPVSGRSTFFGRRLAKALVGMPEPVHSTDVLSDEYVRELVSKCDTRLAGLDLEGAITTGRTMLEAVLLELERRLIEIPGDHKGDLQRLYKSVAKQLKLDEERVDLDDNFKQLVRGLIQIVNGLAPIRNKMSDGHARERKPAPHHARVIVNAAKTVSTFLVESYVYQREKGVLVARTGDKGASP